MTISTANATTVAGSTLNASDGLTGSTEGAFGLVPASAGRTQSAQINAIETIIDQIKKDGVYDDIWQAFCVYLPVKTVGVMGDERTYEDVIALRAVTSLDGMTANWSRIPYDILERTSVRIINEVKGINRVVYDISTKPPSTIEWE